MKTIQKESVAEYHNINISDAILMLPVMDKLVKELRDTAEAYYAHQDMPEEQFFFKEEYIKITERLNLLYVIGFRASEPWQRDDVIYPFE